MVLIDLNVMSKTLYEALGPKESIRLFKHNMDLTEFDGTDHSLLGAYQLARCIVGIESWTWGSLWLLMCRV